MKNINLSALVAIGLVGHLSAGSTETTAADPSHGNMGYKMMSDEELSLELNQEGWDLYKSLSPEGKQLARQVASRRCGGTNTCKGLNACATAKNDCAGKGSCKGLTKCSLSDKNLAIRLAAKKMAEKRSTLTK